MKEIKNMYFFFVIDFHICGRISNHYNMFNIPRASFQPLAQKWIQFSKHSLRSWAGEEGELLPNHHSISGTAGQAGESEMLFF